MPCYSLLSAYQVRSGSKVVFKAPAGKARALFLPCGQCVGCRLERVRQWAVRCVNEAQLYDRNCFVTLTYKVAPLSLEYRDFQLFMKRLRKHFPSDRIRFFMCGEYGEENSRPHFHACLFNFDFADKTVFRSGTDYKLFRSPVLETLWRDGFSTIGDVTFESASYVASYVMKKELGSGKKVREILDVTTGEIVERAHEFCKSSLKPGIGAEWIKRFHSDVYPHGSIVVNGVERKPPRFYDLRFKSLDSDGFALLQRKRIVEADRAFDDNGPSRLRVKAVVAKSRLLLNKRSI